MNIQLTLSEPLYHSNKIIYNNEYTTDFFRATVSFL